MSENNQVKCQFFSSYSLPKNAISSIYTGTSCESRDFIHLVWQAIVNKINLYLEPVSLDFWSCDSWNKTNFFKETNKPNIGPQMEGESI